VGDWLGFALMGMVVDEESWASVDFDDDGVVGGWFGGVLNQNVNP